MERRSFLTVAAGSLLLAGCGAHNGTAPSSTSASPASAAPAGPPVDLNFTAKTLSGSKFSGQSLAGKPALLWFWAPWCPICSGEIAEVRAVVDQFAGQVSVVGIGGLDKAAAIRVGPEAIPGVITLVDADGAVWRRFGITEQAVELVLDATSRVASSTLSDPDTPLSARVARVVGGT